MGTSRLIRSFACLVLGALPKAVSASRQGTLFVGPWGWAGGIMLFLGFVLTVVAIYVIVYAICRVANESDEPDKAEDQLNLQQELQQKQQIHRMRIHHQNQHQQLQSVIQSGNLRVSSI